MKKRNNKMMIVVILLLLSLIILTGAALSWFTDFVSQSVTATAGTVKLNDVALLIEQEQADPVNPDDEIMGATSLVNWNPGDVNSIKWVISNAGNKSVITRNSLNIVWDTEIDLPETTSVFIYPATMTDAEIKTDISNGATGKVNVGTDDKTITTSNGIRTGYSFQFLGNILDGVGVGAEFEEGRNAGTTITSQVVRYKIAFASSAGNEFQAKPLYIGFRIDAIQYRNSEVITVGDSKWSSVEVAPVIVP